MKSEFERALSPLSPLSLFPGTKGGDSAPIPPLVKKVGASADAGRRRRRRAALVYNPYRDRKKRAQRKSAGLGFTVCVTDDDGGCE